MLGKNASWFQKKSLKNLSWVLRCLPRIMVKRRQVHPMAAEYRLANEGSGGANIPCYLSHAEKMVE